MYNLENYKKGRFSKWENGELLKVGIYGEYIEYIIPYNKNPWWLGNGILYPTQRPNSDEL